MPVFLYFIVLGLEIWLAVWTITKLVEIRDDMKSVMYRVDTIEHRLFSGERRY